MALPRLTSLFFLGLSLQRRYGCDMFLLLVLGALISALLISGLSLCCGQNVLENNHLVLSVPGTSSQWKSYTFGYIERHYRFTTFDMAAGVIILTRGRVGAVTDLGPRMLYLIT